MIIRFLWMIFIGWWLAGIFYVIGAILTLLIITSPLGMVVMQKLGWAFSLYDGKSHVYAKQQQTHFLVRYLYFIFIGWWVGIIAYIIAVILGVLIIGLPFSIMIMNRMGKIMTLAS